MIKFIYKVDNKAQSKIIHITEDHVDLPTVLEAFQDFLKGCGYFFDGYIDIVNDEEVNKVKQKDSK